MRRRRRCVGCGRQLHAGRDVGADWHRRRAAPPEPSAHPVAQRGIRPGLRVPEGRFRELRARHGHRLAGGSQAPRGGCRGQVGQGWVEERSKDLEG
eukprot:329270-Pyramimonas_sp.AAC.1